ncbi:hypothetical protein ACOTDT_19070 [Achromobacter xylosoxidans]
MSGPSDRAEEAGISPVICAETRLEQHRGVRPWPFWPTAQHIPGDTRTPPAPGAVRIGPEDV